MRNFKRKWTLDRTKYMTAPEVTELRRTIESKAKEDLEHGRTTWPRFWMALDLALGAGLRVSEIATLRIGNLYLNEREPRLRVTGKGRKERDVFISTNLMKHLSDYLLWKRLMAEPMVLEAVVLVSSHRKPYARLPIRRARQVRQSVGEPKSRPRLGPLPASNGRGLQHRKRRGRTSMDEAS